jgi:thiamine-phosphate pyrophosphorylase
MAPDPANINRIMAISSEQLRGLYAITDSRLSPPSQILRHVEESLQGGARIIQYRDKSKESARREKEAQGILELCQKFQALLIINDDIDLARKTKAHGVHLGQQDPPLAEARKRLGSDALIGISCYNRLELATVAAAAGADYIAFGRFFPSHSKPEAVQADLSLLVIAKRTITKPLVAIGGITPENGAPLIRAGADMLAVIQGVFGQPDIQSASRRLSALFTSQEKIT